VRLACPLYEQPQFREAARSGFRPGGLQLTDEMAEECVLSPGERVLDLGCGVGSTATHLAARWGVSAVAMDSSERFLDEARRSGSAVGWILGAADSIPYPDGHFDAVFCECFLSAVEEPARVLTEVRRVLRPGGRLALSDMYYREPGAARGPGDLPVATCLGGATGIELTLALLARTGFAVRTWHDRSDALKTLFASLIMTYGSASAFWAAAGGGEDGRPEWLEAAKPGYFILVAERSPAACEEPDRDR
jgi:arsenite methyltransferase